MKKLDVIVVISFILLGILGFLLNSIISTKGDTVLIYCNGELYGTYSLNEDRDIVINNLDKSNTVSICNDSVCMKEANCGNQYCVKEGIVNKNKDTICCAPNGVMVVISSVNKGDYDAITQ